MNEDVNENGMKRTRRTQLTDMGVVVIDAPSSSCEPEKIGEPGDSTSNADSSERHEQELLADDDAPADATAQGEIEKRSRLKRALLAASIIVGLIGIVTGGVYLWLSTSARRGEAYEVKSPAPSASGGASDQSRGITAEEIARELKKPDASSEKASAASLVASATDNSSPISSPVTDRLPNESFSTTVSADSSTNSQPAVAVSPQTERAEQGSSASGYSPGGGHAELANPTVSGFSPEHSIRVSARQADQANNNKNATNASSVNSTPAIQSESAAKQESESATGMRAAAQRSDAVTLPPFGAVLPVRTLGTIFTLRAGSYVRLQLTRDMSGRGWSLKRGTEFYGVARGAETETGRAFISLAGFIDPDTNRLVRLQGNVMGSDGADGVRGRAHKLNSGWVNALKRVGATVLDTATTVATGVGKRPIVIADVSGSSRVVAPIAQEISGVAIGGQQGNGFIEVPAGTACYVLVTTSPREIQGVDANVNGTTGNPVLSSNSAQSFSQQPLSESELAELLTSGDKNSVRRALPRMTPQMRRVAEAFLANK
jgi:hypothetical protein